MIKIGIIGLGHWGPNFVRNFCQGNMAFVKYACDLNPKKLFHIRQLYPDVITTRNYRVILEDRDIDAVVIATPAATHYTFAKECLASRKHILVEKPITTNLAQAQEIIDKSIKTKLVLMVGHTFIYNPAIRKIKEYIDKGGIGKIYYLYSRRTNLGPLRQDVNAVWDLAPHDISIFSYFLGTNPIEVSAKGASYLQKSKEDVAFITLSYPRQIIANIHVSWLDPVKIRQITVVGEKKMLVFDDLDAAAPVKIYDKRVMKKKFRQDYDTFEEFRMIIQDGKTVTAKVRMEEPLKIECRHFLECIKENKLPLTGGVNGLNVLKVLLAAQESLDKNINMSLKEQIRCH